MHVRFSHGVLALLATTALSNVSAYAQEGEALPEATSAQGEADSALRQDTIVIRGAFIPDEKRETSEISSLLSAEDFAVQGDSDVAAALRRVTGVSIADSKFVYVRGLNERYSSSTLNGSPLPSPEPLRRVAPLDLFPTSILKSTIVQKTFSPEFSGEFGGGNVDIRTKSVPLEGFMNLGVSAGGNTETSFQDGLTYEGGDTDWTGIDDGARDLPAGLEKVIQDGTYNDLTDAEKNAFSQQLVEGPDLSVLQEVYVGPDFGIDFSAGDRYELNDTVSLGVMGTVSYSNEWKTKDGVSGIGEFTSSKNSPVRFLGGDKKITTNNIGTNALGAVGLEFYSGHEVQLLGFLSRSTDKTASQFSGIDEDSSDTFRRDDELTWIDRQLWTAQLAGESNFDALSNLKINWRASYSEAERDAPYEFTAGYTRDIDAEDLTFAASDTSIRNSNILDDTSDIAADVLLPLDLGLFPVDIKTGFSIIRKNRESSTVEFVPPSGTPSDTQRVDYLLATYFEQNPGESFNSTQSETSPDYSKAKLEVDAYYFGLDSQLTQYMRAAVGVRYEESFQQVETRAFEAGEGTPSAPIEEERFLPAATLTWNFADELQLRVGYSETVTRPQFRELSPTFFKNPEDNVGFFGNKFLKDAELTNYDARLEYYFGRDQFVTIGGFYKDIVNVIEEIQSTDEQLSTTFANIPKAELFGVELEYEQQIPLYNLASWEWLDSKDFTLRTNYTWSQSELSYDEGETFVLTDRAQSDLENEDRISNYIPNGRAMAGQSDHLVNFQFGYADSDAQSEATFLLNWASERIRYGSNGGIYPNTIEQPPLTVDFIYNRDFNFIGGEYSFGLKLQNLLNEGDYWFMEGAGNKATVKDYDAGRKVSVSLKRTF